MSAIRRKRMGIKIDMTPMVDVAFLLLIFYMSTTQFKPPDKEQIRLPESHSDLQAPERNIITLTVNQDSKLTLRYQARDQSGKTVKIDLPVEPADLENQLTRARQYAPMAYMIVRMDKDAKYGTMSDVMDVLQRTQLTRFNVMTEIAR
ncbi:MAG TPA: biopolymer transporter ExbD [Candidatus Saccharimonadales bacterium]|nr:biopolymer transporter ExbD [Candidatus Saccharimonadales bacterium]